MNANELARAKDPDLRAALGALRRALPAVLPRIAVGGRIFQGIAGLPRMPVMGRALVAVPVCRAFIRCRTRRLSTPMGRDAGNLWHCHRSGNRLDEVHHEP